MEETESKGRTRCAKCHLKGMRCHCYIKLTAASLLEFDLQNTGYGWTSSYLSLWRIFSKDLRIYTFDPKLLPVWGSCTDFLQEACTLGHIWVYSLTQLPVLCSCFIFVCVFKVFYLPASKPWRHTWDLPPCLHIMIDSYTS